MDMNQNNITEETVQQPVCEQQDSAQNETAAVPEAASVSTEPREETPAAAPAGSVIPAGSVCAGEPPIVVPPVVVPPVEVPPVVVPPVAVPTIVEPPAAQPPAAGPEKVEPEEPEEPQIPVLPLPDPVSDFRGVISAFGFSQQGASHVAKDMPCQDRSSLRFLSDNVVIAAIADGVGSCALSDYGSSTAVAAALDFLEQHLGPKVADPAFKMDAPFMGQLLRQMMQHCYDQVEKKATDMEQLLYSLQSTLTVAVYDGQTMFFAHAGDDGIVVLTRQGQCMMATSRHKGLEASSVYPLQSRNTWQYGMVADVVGFVMATDGVLDAFVRHEAEGNRVYYPFVEPAFYTPLHDAQETAAICAEWDAYMKAPGYRANVTDDLSFVCVVNQEAIKTSTKPDFDIAKWQKDTQEYAARRKAALYPPKSQEKKQQPQAAEPAAAAPQAPAAAPQSAAPRAAAPQNPRPAPAAPTRNTVGQTAPTPPTRNTAPQNPQPAPRSGGVDLGTAPRGTQYRPRQNPAGSQTYGPQGVPNPGFQPTPSQPVGGVNVIEVRQGICEGGKKVFAGFIEIGSSMLTFGRQMFDDENCVIGVPVGPVDITCPKNPNCSKAATCDKNPNNPKNQKGGGCD